MIVNYRGFNRVNESTQRSFTPYIMTSAKHYLGASHPAMCMYVCWRRQNRGNRKCRRVTAFTLGILSAVRFTFFPEVVGITRARLHEHPGIANHHNGGSPLSTTGGSRESHHHHQRDHAGTRNDLGSLRKKQSSHITPKDDPMALQTGSMEVSTRMGQNRGVLDRSCLMNRC